MTSVHAARSAVAEQGALLATTKRDAVFEAGRLVFLKHGYRASMDRVAAEAGVSKQTVYSHFGSKEGLFRAIIEGCTEEFLTVLVDRPAGASEPGKTLAELGERFLGLLLDPDSLALHRMLVAEAPRFPDLADEFYRAGPGRAARRLAGYLEQQDRQGVLAVPDPLRSAEQFLGALTGHVQLRALLGVSRPSPEEVGLVVQHAVQAFLGAHQPRGSR